MGISIVYDATGANLAKVTFPKGVMAAGYDTGSDGIAWTTEQYAAHPGALHIDQDVKASDFTADILDVENGAATPGEAPDWYVKARASFEAGKRPGQREPAIYVNMVNVHQVANELVAAGITSGPKLFLANWNDSNAEAIATVGDASGPYPVCGVQFANAGTHDVSVFDSGYLSAVSGPRATATTLQWEYYKDGFGWVYAGGEVRLPLSRLVRVRASNGRWTGYTEVYPLSV